jgi:tetratricopeptide (TPR) repeat protein
MLANERIFASYDRITLLLDQRELKSAFGYLLGFIGQCNGYAFQARLDELQTTYLQMLGYRMADIPDPMQNDIYNNILIGAYELADTIKAKAMEEDASGEYYKIKQLFQMNPDVNISRMAAGIRRYAAANDRENLEGSAESLFNSLWMLRITSDTDKETLHDLMSDNSLPEMVGCLMASALTISLISLFGIDKLDILLDAAVNAPSEEVRVRALVGVLIVLSRYSGRAHLYPRIAERLAIMNEQPGFNRRLLNITQRFILAKDTENISRRLREEIMPTMMKILPELKKIGRGDFTPDAVEMNPEWDRLMHDGSIEKTIKEYASLQEEGADVMHSSFTHLKNHPFFNSCNNWFMPFDREHTAIASLSERAGSAKVFIQMIKAIPTMCDSDKYSLCLTFMQSQPELWTMVANEYNDETSESISSVDELAKLDAVTYYDAIVGRYVQDLYRFYKLCPNRSDFEDIFAWPLDFYNIPVLKPYMSDKASLTSIAEYQLKKQHFDEAAPLFETLVKESPADNMLWQKFGYCLQMMGETAKALRAYLMADVIDSGSKWLTTRIAGCYRASGQPDKAVEYYLRLEELNPRDLSIQLNIGHCMMETGEYEEALKRYFKVEYLHTQSHKARRAIAWTSFLAGKYEQADRYYALILSEDEPTVHDYINAGHVAWSLKNLKQASTHYMAAVKVEEGNDFNVFLEEFEKDMPHLRAAGISDDEVPLMLDAVRYQLADIL